MGNIQFPCFLILEAEPQMFRRKTTAGTLTVWCPRLFFLVSFNLHIAQFSSGILQIRDTVHHSAAFCGTLTQSLLGKGPS
ncbi:hypothetical protein COCC4DRAFT_30537 [Bipolaris maydis ATCC 48331]|uniref:Uncharacterized protein n=2 Tax=Cochliobolus heterostrophus TaxID=5016 RepID=M2UU15_COCH5|nr:uncharacterized protein COCC4DRAFT_30537 [Bipolaris maydis ATCC 48331]EMD91337.1 hypothetical protein COCHEDRAFT_1021401 [Bipolaris maydis C5]ENI08906.1 hypothetical protein COCC4DRAFT_30537 [Bipolaris maydis ATCC 48331]